jgi:hypothetical protein
MLVTGKDGRSTFHDVRVEPAPSRRLDILRGDLAADGALTIRYRSDDEDADVELDAHRLGGPGAADALRDLATAFRNYVKDRRASEAGAEREIQFELHAAAGAKWQWIQWILQTCALPGVEIRHVVFAPAWGRPALEHDLPADEGPRAAPAPEPPSVRASLTRQESGTPEAYTRIRVGDWTIDLPPSAATDDTAHSARIGELRHALRRELGVLGGGARVVGVLGAPPPGGSEVPYRDVRAVLEAFREVGVETVQFEGSPLPR